MAWPILLALLQVYGPTIGDLLIGVVRHPNGELFYFGFDQVDQIIVECDAQGVPSPLGLLYTSPRQFVCAKIPSPNNRGHSILKNYIFILNHWLEDFKGIFI